MGSARLFPLSKPPASIEPGTKLTLRNNPLFDAAFYAKRYSLGDFETLDLYQHYVYVGRFSGFDPNEYFSTSWYLRQYKDVRALRIDPLDHYLDCGATEGRDPSPAFSTSLYRLLYPDVGASGVNPLLHYLRHGRQEGRLAPPAALVPALHVMNDAAAVAALDPRLVDAARPVARALSCWTTRLSRAGEIAPQDDVGAMDRDVPFDANAAGPGGRRPDAAIDAPRPSRPIRHGSRRTEKPDATGVVARRSPWRVRLFAALFARDLAASFHAVRLFGPLPSPVEGPLVILTNHPSWWDAELYHWLAVTAFPERRGFAPMDAAHLAEHRFLTRLGAFPVSPGSFSGAAAFLTTAERILQACDALLFVAAEGRYRDVRDRPIQLMPGVAHLARRMPEATFVPLAIDHVFWGERRPNLLLRFGEPIRGDALAGSTTAAASNCLGRALEAAMSALGEAGRSRQPQRFRTLLTGRGRIKAVGDLWRRSMRFRTDADGTAQRLRARADAADRGVRPR